MSEQKFDKQSVWVICASCGHQHRNHRVLYEKVQRYADDPHGSEIRREYHRFVECMGCEATKYVISSMDLLNHEEFEPPHETNFIVHPDAPGAAVKRAATINNDDELVPASVWKMYRETIEAVNANIRTLAGGGLRAVVEAICLDKQITVIGDNHPSTSTTISFPSRLVGGKPPHAGPLCGCSALRSGAERSAAE